MAFDNIVSCFSHTCRQLCETTIGALLLPGSFTPDILNLVNLTNNGIPGSFVFRIDATPDTGNETFECDFGELRACGHAYLNKPDTGYFSVSIKYTSACQSNYFSLFSLNVRLKCTWNIHVNMIRTCDCYNLLHLLIRTRSKSAVRVIYKTAAGTKLRNNYTFRNQHNVE